MRSQSKYLLFLTLILGVYYLVWAIYLNRAGYATQEGLFYIEKSRIIFSGLGTRLKVMGLTAPIIPFYISFIFSAVSPLLAPVIASAVCTALLFYLMASTLLKHLKDDFYLWILLSIFVFHPGVLYTACSGKSI